MPAFHVFSPGMTHAAPARRGVGPSWGGPGPWAGPAGRRLHVGGVGPVGGLGDAEGEATGAGEELGHPLLLLGLGAVVEHEEEADVVADDPALVLEVVVEAEPLAGEVLADDRHAQ